MDKCHCCRKKINIMSFTCPFCHNKHCIYHQLPENHSCDIRSSDVYEKYKTNVKEDTNTYRVNKHWTDNNGHVGA